eukprot:jgi/Bigna1/72825/fgenesh1_pg.21_\
MAPTRVPLLLPLMLCLQICAGTWKMPQGGRVKLEAIADRNSDDSVVAKRNLKDTKNAEISTEEEATRQQSPNAPYYLNILDDFEVSEGLVGGEFCDARKRCVVSHFVHIPKTGGTSVRAMMPTWYRTVGNLTC